MSARVMETIESLVPRVEVYSIDKSKVYSGDIQANM